MYIYKSGADSGRGPTWYDDNLVFIIILPS